MDVLALANGTLQSIKAATAIGTAVVRSGSALAEAELKFKLSELMLALASANTDMALLREALIAESDWLQKREQYPLHKTEAGTLVRKFTGEPSHFACPSCFENKHLAHPLQPTAGYDRHGMMCCPSCEARYQVRHERGGTRYAES